MSADISRKAHETLLFLFLARHSDLVGVDHDHEIAGVYVRSENRLFLPAQQLRGLDGYATKDLIFGIDQPPRAVDFVGLGGKSFHRRSEKGTETTGRGGDCQPMESGAFRALKVLYDNYNAP